MLKSLFKPKPPTAEQVEALDKANLALRGRMYQMIGSSPELGQSLAVPFTREKIVEIQAQAA